MKLLTPGPVSTHRTVRAALTRDLAPWDPDFSPLYHGLRARLLRFGGGQDGVHITVPLPGCGHFVTEAAIRSLIPPGGRLLVPMTGNYAERMVRLAREAGRAPVPLPVDPAAPADPAAVRAPCWPMRGSRISGSSTTRPRPGWPTTSPRSVPRRARSDGT